MRVLRTALVTTAALALLAPLAGGAAAAFPANRACSDGPYSGPTGSGTIPGCTTRVSMGYNNVQPNGTSQRPRISEDGNYVVFQSGADRLVPDYAPGHGTDDYWVDKNDPAGTIEMIDRAADGGMPNGAATFVDVTGDGRYAVFYSAATNLVAGRTTRTGSIFLRDMALNRTLEVARSSSGGSVDGYSNRPTVSGYAEPGTGYFYVTYNSKGTNLVPGNSHPNDIYVTRFDPRTFTAGLPALVSRTASRAASNGGNEHAEISSDGRFIAWASDATNLDSRANGKTQIYESANPLIDSTAYAVLVSVSSGGAAGNQASTRPAIDGNGDEVAWQSTSNNLVAGDTNVALDAFLRGTRAGAFIGAGSTIRVSVDYNGGQLAGASQRPNLDAAGDTVGFAANAHTVVRGDVNGQRDVFLRDLRTGINTLVDVCQFGRFGGGEASCGPAAPPRSNPAVDSARPGGEDLSSRAFLSADGLSVAFISGMADLVPGDTNAGTSLDDIFVRDFSTGGSIFGPNESWTTSPYYGSRATLFADVDADRRADAVAVNNNALYVRRSTGSRFGDTTAWTAEAFYGSVGTFLADVNGDNRADAIAVNSNGVYVKQSTGAAFASATKNWSGAFYGSRATAFADVNGDGKADAIAVNSSGVYVKLSTGVAFGPTKAWAGPFYGSGGTFFADVDGDRRADAIAVNSTGTTVRLSTGSSFGPNGPTAGAVPGSRLRFADVNGNGQADAVYFGVSRTTVYFSTGNSFDSGHGGTTGPFYGSVATACADVTGDGHADAIAVNRSNITVRRAT